MRRSYNYTKTTIILYTMIFVLSGIVMGYSQTASSNRFKRIDYDYDLISGKVNKVTYQKDSADQFIQQYSYDSDNRITKVETSNDNVVWDVEAKYFYYAHGPLARTEYGDVNNQVQGVDYAYTIQGWIKGVNSNTLDKNRDMGQDGLANEIYDPANPQLHSNIAKDAFGYSLNYFKNDYKAVGYLRWSSVTNRFEASTTGSDLMNSRNDLFNGNITSMVTTIVKPTITPADVYEFTPLPQGASYKYDQLNRLKEMRAWQNLNSSTNTWNSGLTYNGMYNNKFSYDANGNIINQLRKEENGTAINDLTYRRYNLAGKTMQNRLYMVDDAVSNTVFTDDIDDQGTFDNTNYTNVKTNNNYGYDEIGSMTRNDQKQIAQIKYTVYGKVKEVIRTSGSTKKNLKFDYDASGNRIAKHVYSSSNVWEKSEYYVVDAQGNVMSVYKHEATGTTPPISFAQIERNIYGSSRIGSDKTTKELIAAFVPSGNISHVLGNKQYDGTNHLGNVLVTFTNKRIAIDADNNNIIDDYWPEVVSSNDYYPFGVKMKNRSFNGANNRYQFNGKQFDEETETSDFGARNLDEDLGVWSTMDIYSKKYSGFSPYNYAQNSPLKIIDVDGNDIIVAGVFTSTTNNGRAGLDMFSSTNVGAQFLKQFVRINDQNVQQGNYNLPNITSSGLLANHSITFSDKKLAKGVTGGTELQIWVKDEKGGGKFVDYDGQQITKDTKFNINIFESPEIINGGGVGPNAYNISHESFLHAQAIAEILIDFEQYKKDNPNASDKDLDQYLTKKLAPYADKGASELGQATEDIQHAKSGENKNYQDAQTQIIDAMNNDPNTPAIDKEVVHKMQEQDKTDASKINVQKTEKIIKENSPE